MDQVENVLRVAIASGRAAAEHSIDRVVGGAVAAGEGDLVAGPFEPVLQGAGPDDFVFTQEDAWHDRDDGARKRQASEGWATIRQNWGSSGQPVVPAEHGEGAIAWPWSTPCSDFSQVTASMCRSARVASSSAIHSEIGFPYFFSMEGKYEAGPWTFSGMSRPVFRREGATLSESAGGVEFGGEGGVGGWRQDVCRTRHAFSVLP